MHPGKLARLVEGNKIRDSQALCRRLGWNFAPFVMETAGTWGGKARHVLQQIVRQWAIRHDCSMKDAAIICRTTLALALVRSIAGQLERGYPLGPEDHAERDPRDAYSL